MLKISAAMPAYNDMPCVERAVNSGRGKGHTSQIIIVILSTGCCAKQ
jgi:hypothetical protein